MQVWFVLFIVVMKKTVFNFELTGFGAVFERHLDRDHEKTAMLVSNFQIF